MKYINLLSCLFLLFISCSSSDDNTTIETPEVLSQEGTLLKRVVSYQAGVVQRSSDYYYTSGNKISTIIANNGSKFTYTYANNLITEQNYYIDNNLNTKYSYSYDSQDRLIQKMIYSYSNNVGTKILYAYNADDTVTVLGYKGDFSTQNTQILNVKVFLLANGNVEKREIYKENNGVNYTEISEYSYDDKFTPTNSIVGYNKIKSWEVDHTYTTNNNLNINYSFTQFYNPYTNTTTFTYNSFGYPKTSSFFDITIQYYYQ